MPDPIRQKLQEMKARVPDTSDRERPVESAWTEYSVLAYEGLMPTQIVRRITEKEGIDRWEATCLPFRTDARPDTDDKRSRGVPFLPNDPTRYVDERRYIVDPVVGKHRFRGLWTGGPVRMTTDKRSNAREVTQVLTLTLCAGHGYTTDEAGNYVCAYTNDGGRTFHDKDGRAIPVEKVRDYQSAEDALRHSRAALGSRLSPYMPLREDIPSSYTREVQWREFTHESMQFLEPLGLRPENHARLADVVTYHFYQLAGEAVTNAACRVDNETNTVIFTAAITYTKLGEPVDPSSLLALPCIETCDRDTMRMFGWGQLEDGEGYKYTHVFRWPRLKDTPEVRSALEFVQDNAPTRDVWAERVPDESASESASSSGSRVLIAPAAQSFVLALLRRHGLLPANGSSAHTWFGNGTYEKRFDVTKRDQIDATGRLETQATALSHTEQSTSGATVTTPSTADVPVQTYRIAKQRIEPDQDGSISFIVALSKAEWHGGDDGEDWETVKTDGKHGSRVLASVSSPQGYGRAEVRVVPSVPRQNAIPTMKGVKAKDPYELVTELRQTEGQDGGSDVSFQRRRLYDYVDPDHTPADIVNIDGTIFNAPDYSFDPETNVYRLSYPQVNKDKVQQLVDRLRRLLGGEPKISARNAGEGAYTVSVTGRALNPRHIAEWVVETTWFQHQTLEQWIGVSVKRDGDSSASGSGSGAGEIVGFYTRYEQREVDGVLMLVPDEASLVRVEAVRGDLDADWMGSDPQAETPSPRAPILYYSLGVGDRKDRRENVGHDDEHGDGWSGGSWTDPDDSGDSADKARSHVITRVHPRINGDGTMDLAITRIYPHQRKWEWEFDQENKDGDKRTIYHASYYNWPSRKAIQDDIIEKFLSDHNGAVAGVQNTEDGFTLSGEIRVNDFGLVNAPGLTLTPNWENSRNKKARAKTYTAHLDQEIVAIEKTHTCPACFKDEQTGDFNTPTDGFWWRLVKYSIYSGETTSKGQAWTEYRRKGAFLEGSKGVEKVNGKPDINALWKWHVVYGIEIVPSEDPSGWRDTKVDYTLATTRVLSSGDGTAAHDNNG